MICLLTKTPAGQTAEPALLETLQLRAALVLRGSAKRSPVKPLIWRTFEFIDPKAGAKWTEIFYLQKKFLRFRKFNFLNQSKGGRAYGDKAKLR